MGESLGGEPFCYTAKNLHLTGRQRHGGGLGQGRSFGYAAKNLRDHLPRNWTLASHSRPERTLQLGGAGILEDITRTAGLHHPQEVVTRLRYSPCNDLDL